MVDSLTGRRARGRRAALRKRAIADQTDPPTTGDLEGTERVASIIFIGAPVGAAKAAARFGPRGFKAAKKGAESVGKYAMRTLKPILSKSAKVKK